MRALVTGGAGFIGSHLVDTLVSEGFEVIILDDLSSGNNQNINKKAKFVLGSILDRSAVSNSIGKCDFVFHLAAQVSVPKSVSNPDETYKINVDGTKIVLEESLKAGVKKVIIASSAAVYGNSNLPLKETDTLDPQNPYGISKMKCEYLASEFVKQGLSVVCLRYFNVYGPRQSVGAVISNFMRSIVSSKPITIFGDGNQVRDYVFVSDVVSANILAAKKAPPGSILNVGTGVATSLLEVLSIIGVSSGVKPLVQFKPVRDGDVSYSCSDISQIAKLGFKPSTMIKDGLKNTLNWYLSNVG